MRRSFVLRRRPAAGLEKGTRLDPARVMGRAMGTLIYKICARAEWEAAATSGVYRGSEADRRDGFIHFSTAAQVDETLRKHFAGRSDLLLVTVDRDALGDELRFEVSRGGELFPHLYGHLPLACAREVRSLPVVAESR
jgi:uncharacterized protein (DUF952 family)